MGGRFQGAAHLVAPNAPEEELRRLVERAVHEREHGEDAAFEQTKQEKSTKTKTRCVDPTSDEKKRAKRNTKQRRFLVACGLGRRWRLADNREDRSDQRVERLARLGPDLARPKYQTRMGMSHWKAF